MAKTLINGTAYEIDHGNTRVNGTNYTIDHGITRVNGTNYNIALAAASSGGGNWSWPGWSSATWQDINNLCKAKQSGDIASWPSDVVVDTSEKSLTFDSTPTSCGLAATVTTRVRALDELPGTITFCIVNDPSAQTTLSAGQTIWSESYNRTRCQSLVTIGSEVTDYLVPVVKRSSTNWNQSSPPSSETTEDTTDYFFLPARYEIDYGFNGSPSEGTVYNGTVKQRMYSPYGWSLSYGSIPDCWTRSRAKPNYVYSANGQFPQSDSRNVYFNPFFIIGNPNAS